MAVLVFNWAYRAADGRRHDFTFLNQGTFFLKWGTFFLLFLTFPYFLYTLERQKKKGKRTAAKEKRTAARGKEQEKNRKKKDRGPWQTRLGGLPKSSVSGLGDFISISDSD